VSVADASVRRYDQGGEARSLVGRAVLCSSGFARRPRTPRGGCRAPPPRWWARSACSRVAEPGRRPRRCKGPPGR